MLPFISRLSRSRAFTLIELLVAILIIAILIAVAAPSLLGQQDKANDSGIKQELTVAYKAAKADSVENTPQGAFKTDLPLANVIGESEPQLADHLNALGAAFAAPSEKGELAVCGNSTDDEVRLVGHSKSDKTLLLTAPKNGQQTIVDGDCGTGISIVVGGGWYPVAKSTSFPPSPAGGSIPKFFARGPVKFDGNGYLVTLASYRGCDEWDQMGMCLAPVQELYYVQGRAANGSPTLIQVPSGSRNIRLEADGEVTYEDSSGTRVSAGHIQTAVFTDGADTALEYVGEGRYAQTAASGAPELGFSQTPGHPAFDAQSLGNDTPLFRVAVSGTTPPTPSWSAMEYLRMQDAELKLSSAGYLVTAGSPENGPMSQTYYVQGETAGGAGTLLSVPSSATDVRIQQDGELTYRNSSGTLASAGFVSLARVGNHGSDAMDHWASVGGEHHYFLTAMSGAPIVGRPGDSVFGVIEPMTLRD